MRKTWGKPRVTVEPVGLEVTGYVSAEIDGA